MTAKLISSLNNGVLSRLLCFVKSRAHVFSLEICDCRAYFFCHGLTIISIESSDAFSEFIVHVEIEHKIKNLPSLVILTEQDTKRWVEYLDRVALFLANNLFEGVCKAGVLDFIAYENKFRNMSTQSDYFIVPGCVNKVQSGLDISARFPFDLVALNRKIFNLKGDFENNSVNFFALLSVQSWTDVSALDDFLKCFDRQLVFFSSPPFFDQFKQYFVAHYVNSSSLGLLPRLEPCFFQKIIQRQKPLFVIVFVNTDVHNTIVLSCLTSQHFLEIFKKISKYVEVRFAVSKCVGYKLFESNMLCLKEFEIYIENFHETMSFSRRY